MTNTIPYVSNTERFRPHITPVAHRLSGKIAIVTGSGSGIGKAIAIRLAQEGAQVLVVDKNLDLAEKTAAEVESLGVRSDAVQVDVTDRAAVDDMVGTAFREFGGLDILVNNAGVLVFGTLLECTVADWERMIAVDLTGAFHCTQAAARRLAERGCGGRLIHIGSTASLLPTPLQAAYSVAKAGLMMMSRMAALELAGYGITSNTLCPQGAITDINRELLSDSAIMSKLERHIPAGRIAKVEEIAAMTAFLASDEAAYITGTELLHDGGATISGLWWR